jgi:D-sedoheptulose 7-phosphate isomerase
MKDTIKGLIEDSIKTKERLLGTELGAIEKAALAIIESFNSGGKLLVFGNGGSAADSQHMAAELVGRFKRERKAFPAIALTTDTSIITAMANDYGFESIFARQVEALGKKGDIALAISTSGNSKNVIAGAKKAKSIGLKTIALAGGDGGMLKNECDISVIVDSKDTARIQESHAMVIHVICELVEKQFSK